MDQLKQIAEAAKKAQEQVQRIEKDLSNMRISYEANGIKCIVTGAGSLISIEVSEVCPFKIHTILSTQLTEVVRKALERAGETAKEKMNEVKRIIKRSGLR